MCTTWVCTRRGISRSSCRRVALVFGPPDARGSRTRRLAGTARLGVTYTSTDLGPLSRVLRARSRDRLSLHDRRGENPRHGASGSLSVHSRLLHGRCRGARRGPDPGAVRMGTPPLLLLAVLSLPEAEPRRGRPFGGRLRHERALNDGASGAHAGRMRRDAGPRLTPGPSAALHRNALRSTPCAGGWPCARGNARWPRYASGATSR